MPTTRIRNLDYIQAKDPKMGEAMKDLLNMVLSIAQQTNVAPQGETPAPPDISRLNVLGQDGIFDVQIFDNSPVVRGINYFLEYSETANFQNVITLDLGCSRNWRGHLGNKTLYWRAYSQYIGSQPGQ